ncbi:MAG TPA: hypothetical protein VE398_06015 [Acidobacteriota bacterium]|nr:hypothetical protein [Acidobacteriota bacterium]
MRWILATLMVGFIPAVAAQTSPPATPSSSLLERAFAVGGKVTMKLSAGSYTVLSGSENKIRVQWKTRKPDQLKGVKVDVQANGSEATIQTRAPRNSDFEAVIELPVRAALRIRLSAGDLQIRGIEGDTDVEAHAGDVTINVGSSAEYGHADASVRAGDIEAPPFGASKGGLFRSFQWQGKGKHSLHVHVGAGSITILGSRE